MIDDSEAGLRLSERFTKVATRDLYEASPIIEGLQGAFIARQQRGRILPEEPVHVRATTFGNVAISIPDGHRCSEALSVATTKRSNETHLCQASGSDIRRSKRSGPPGARSCILQRSASRR